MAWRVARSLEKLREQLDAAWPRRGKASDGTIGDAAHASRSSDHNPWHKVRGVGVVTARDITHDPASGADMRMFREALRRSRDYRIKYVVAFGEIMSSTTSPWLWRRYTGPNPHNRHLHISVHPGPCDDSRPWNVFGTVPLTAPPKTAPKPPTTPPPKPKTAPKPQEQQEMETIFLPICKDQKRHAYITHTNGTSTHISTAAHMEHLRRLGYTFAGEVGDDWFTAWPPVNGPAATMYPRP
jgi:hypothetical protein